MTVSERKDLSSRDDAGLVVLDVEMTKGDGTVVLEGDMKFLVKRRDAE
jgi:hypothetical protein